MKNPLVLTVFIACALLLGACGGPRPDQGAAAKGKHVSAAQRVYVPPGKWDDYYAFLSGGQSGGIFVYGIPSCRLIKEIPIFEPRAALGYANDKGTESYRRLAATGPMWGDVHHPVLSQTDGRYDGKWLWVNDKANGRVARVDLRTFEVAAIQRIPNIQGAHGLAACLPTCKYLVTNGELEHPIPNETTNPAPYLSVVAFVDAMSLKTKFEILLYGNADIATSGKDGHYVFSTMYNSENAVTSEGMIERDKDDVIAMDVPRAEKALAAGQFTKINGVPVLDPKKIPGLVTLIPTPKNPHGIDVTPDGKYAIASGKLSPTVTIIDAHTLKVLAEPEVGLGPLHTTFDNRGNAYTTLFIDSQVVKWNIAKAIQGDPHYIIDRLDVHYNPGHLKAAGADTSHPSGDWLLSLNKLSKGMYLPVGPDMPDSEELIDITGKQMKLVAAFPAIPEPHDAVFLKRQVIEDKVVQTYTPSPTAVKPGDERVVRHGKEVGVYMTCLRSKFTPEQFEVHAGDHITLHLSNVETIRDMTHGFALEDYGINLGIDPGQTRVVSFTAGKPGVYWYYCTWFCSALHLEMRGRMIVKPAGAKLADHLGRIPSLRKARAEAGKEASKYE